MRREKGRRTEEEMKQYYIIILLAYGDTTFSLNI
jgi:hypothetical protein